VALTAVDTSLLVPALAPWHAEHRRADETLGRTANLRMIGHVLLETYCWLTRNRPRTPPSVASSLLRSLPGPAIVLSLDGHARVLERAASYGIVGGAVYDALIAAAASEANAVLLSRDERAARTYEMMGVQFELV
jgi:toxin FitB